MAAPDVRIRLSAEGLADVVAAFQKIKAEADKAAKQSGSSFGNLLNSVGGLKGVLASLGATVGIGALKGIIQSASDSSERILNLKQSLASSVNELVAFDHAATLSGSSLSELSRPLAQFAEKTNEALAGGKAQGLFKALRLTDDEIKQFGGASTIQRFSIVAQAMDRLQRSGESVGLEAQALGKRVLQLDPVLDQFAKKGIGGLIAEAKDLGLVLDEDILKRSADLGDDFDRLGEQAGALGKQFTSGFAELAAPALKVLQGELGKSGGAFHALGRAVGLVAGIVVAGITVIVDTVYTAAIAIISELGVIATVISQAFRGDWAGVQRTWAKGTADLIQTGKDFGGRMTKVWKTLTEKTTETTREGAQKEKADLTQVYAERLALIKAKLEQELKAIKAQLSLREDAEQRQFDRGLESVRAYYENRRRIIASGINDEIAALLKARAAVEAQGSGKDQTQEVARINSEIAQLVAERTAATMKLTDEEFAQVKSLGEQRLDLEKKLAEARGDRVTAALIDNQREIDAADELLAKLGETEAESKRVIESIRQSNLSQIEFTKASTDATDAFADFNRDRAEVQKRIDAGIISEIDGTKQIVALERDRLPQLRAIAATLTEAAQGTGRDDLIRQAQEFTDSVEEIDLAIQATEGAADRLGASLEDAAKGGLEEFFTTGITQAKSFTDAMRLMVLAVSQQLQALIGKLLAAKLAAAIFGSLGGGGSDIPGIAGQASDVITAADGGLIQGPGTSTSDSIPALLSDGEYVVRAAAVARPGALEALEALNRGSMSPALRSHAYGLPRGFADGGLVGAPDGSAGLDGTVTVGLEDGLVARKIATNAGQRAVLRVLQQNPKAARQALGL